MPLHCTAIGKALLAYSAPNVLAQRVAAGLPALVIGPGSAMALFGHGPMILWLACAGLGLFAALIILSGKD